MKKNYVLTLFFLFILTIGYSQDYIIETNNTEIKAIVLEVGTDKIKYKNWGDTSDAVLFILKASVKKIVYQDGSQLVISASNATSTDKVEGKDMFFKGSQDADAFYTNYKGAGTTTLIVSLISPLIGLIPAIVCSSTRPSMKNLVYPRQDLMDNVDYARGYQHRAKQIKSRKVWKNFGIAFGVNLGLLLITAK